MSEEPTSFDQRVSKCCHPEPVVSTTLSTGSFMLTVKVYRATYGNYLNYYIACDVPWKPKPFIEHPFRQLNCEVTDEITNVSEVVADNDFIRCLFQYLTMPDDELTPKIGHTSPVEYRACLIRSLQYFWD